MSVCVEPVCVTVILTAEDECVCVCCREGVTGGDSHVILEYFKTVAS